MHFLRIVNLLVNSQLIDDGSGRKLFDELSGRNQKHWEFKWTILYCVIMVALHLEVTTGILKQEKQVSFYYWVLYTEPCKTWFLIL